MCYIIRQLLEDAATRSHLSSEFGAAPNIFGIPPSGADLTRQYERIAQAKSDALPFKTRLILLGTAGGATYWTNTNRRSASSAVVVGDAIYIVDCGDGAGKRRLARRVCAHDKIRKHGYRGRQMDATPGS